MYGQVIVLRKGNVVGVVEAKDLMRRVFVDGLDIKAATVADVMSSDPETIASNKSVTLALEEASAGAGMLNWMGWTLKLQ